MAAAGFVRHEHTAVQFEIWSNRLQRHAKIQIMKRAVAFDAPQPAGLVRSLIRFHPLGRDKTKPPIRGGGGDLGIASALKPRIAQQSADRTCPDVRRAGKKPQVCRIQKIGRTQCRARPRAAESTGSENQNESRGARRAIFQRKDFLRKSEDVRCETAFGESSFFQAWGTYWTKEACKRCFQFRDGILASIFPKPIYK